MVAFFLAVLTGAVLAANSDAEEALEDPLIASMADYDDGATSGEAKKVTDAWDDVQQEVKSFCNTH